MREKVPAAAVQGEPPGATQAQVTHHRGGEDGGRASSQRIDALQENVKAVEPVSVGARDAAAPRDARHTHDHLDRDVLDQVGDGQTVRLVAVGTGRRHAGGAGPIGGQQEPNLVPGAAVMLQEARTEVEERLASLRINRNRRLRRWAPRSSVRRTRGIPGTNPGCREEASGKRPRRTSRMRMASAGTSSSGLDRSEEHTSELQSPCNLVCRLLLEKKKNKRSPAIQTRV